MIYSFAFSESKKSNMVSIETYRARIGLFKAGKPKQGTSGLGFDPALLEESNPMEYPNPNVPRIRRKFLGILALLKTAVVATLLNDKVPKGWKTENNSVFHSRNLETNNMFCKFLKPLL